MMKIATRAAFGLAVSLAAFGSASATPVTFTWNPSAIGLTTQPSGSNIVANNFNVSDFADVTITGTSFTESATLTALQFLSGGNPVPLNGLQSTYSFYATVTATGTISGAIPANGSGQTVNGNFTTAVYTFWANPGSQPTVTINPGGAPTISGNANAFALFTGSLVSGTTGLTAVAGGGYAPQADLNLSLTACTAAGQPLATGGTCAGNESAFFVNPLPADLALAITNFSATTSVTTLTPGSPTTLLDINGGGGNVTFAVATVPEPASLVIIGTSLVGLGIARRRKRS